MTNEMNEKLGVARELLNAEGSESARAIRRGAEIVRELAEREDVLEAWELILWGHEKGLSPFKTNKFGRMAKNALARLKGSVEFLPKGIVCWKQSVIPRCRIFLGWKIRRKGTASCRTIGNCVRP